VLVPDFGDLIDRRVEEETVVGNEHEGVGVVVEIVFEPVAGFESTWPARLRLRAIAQKIGLRDS